MILIAKNTRIYRFNDSITYFIMSVNSYYCFVSNFTMNNPKLISVTKYFVQFLPDEIKQS